MALNTPVYGAVAYSGAGGTSVAPAYPTNTTGDQLLLIIGMKPSTANSGSVTTPSGWTLVNSITGQGGYGATLGVDTGNTNLFIYTRTAPSGGLSGSLTVTVATNNICWGIIAKVTSSTGNANTVTAWMDGDGAGGNVVGNFATGTGLKPNSQLHMVMCIPTDVTTPAQFSGYALTATGVTFGTITEIAEPDSATGNDIGGFIAWGTVSTGTSSGNTTLNVTAGGTTTNVRGALALISIEEVPTARTITIDVGSYTMTGTDADIGLYKSSDNQTGIFYDALSTTFLPMQTPPAILRVKTSSVAQLNFSGSYEFYPSGVINGGYPTEVIWRYRTIGGSWTDVGTAIANSQPAVIIGGVVDTTGTLDLTTSLSSGLSANTLYDVQILWRRTLASPSTPEMVSTPVGTDYATVSAVIATGYTITIDSGSYTLTGSAVGLVYGRRVVIDSGSYSLTGTAVNLARGQRIVIDSGSYSVTGTNANLLFARSIIIGAGSYALNGTAVGLVAGRVIVANAGSYAYSGTDVTLTLTTGRTITIDSGSYSLTGSDVGLAFGRRVGIDSGSYALSGSAVNFLYARRVTIDSGSYALSGTAVNLVTGRRIVIDSGSYSLSGSAVGTLYGRRIVADVGSYTYSGSAVGLAISRSIVIGAGSYALTGSAVNVLYGRRVLIEGGAYTVTGSAVGLVASRRLIVDSGSYALTGTDVALSVTTNKIITIDAGSYSLSGSAVGLIYSRRLVIDAGSYAYNGSAVGLVRGRRVIIDSGAYTYAGTAVGLMRGRRIIIDSGAYSYTGSAVGVFRNRTIGINSGVYNLTGTAVTLTYTTGISNLYLGADPVVNMKYGTISVSKVYKGSTQVYG
jgi:hypothetical protein